MQFEYEIPIDEYVAGQDLYFQLSAGRKRIKTGLAWILEGAILIFVALNGNVLNWPKILLLPIGAWSIYLGMAHFFPRWNLRRQYQASGLAGKKFQAHIDEEGFELAGDLCTWRIRWAGASIKGENERVFLLYSSGTLFTIGKKFLTDEQQHEFRKLAALTAR
jgi:hypothetical protein